MKFTLKKALSVGFGVGLVVVIIFYAYYQSRAIIEGPQIEIIEPENNATASSSLLTIRGTTIHAKELTLDGRPIFIDLEGRFREQLLLSPGYNIIELTAKDAQGREIKKRLEIAYTPSVGGITL